MNQLRLKIERNRKRMESSLYTIDNIFQSREYDWPGDWEGRALLAFCCHLAISGKEMPCMRQMVEKLPFVTNKQGYFGTLFDGKIVNEQQISGHSWYLRGLIEYYKQTGEKMALEIAQSVVKNMYLPIINHYTAYPLQRKQGGGVSGNLTDCVNGWLLSTDVGCAYMCVDGLAQYYALTHEPNVKVFLDTCIRVFEQTDFVFYGFQTHTTLSCARGIMTMYHTTGDLRYLNLAEKVFTIYVQKGMTLTYENYNWFNKEDSWTEPCAVTDSLLLAVDLYKTTDKHTYRSLARKIWYNGLSFCQRENGGAGPNSCVKIGQAMLEISMYEAPFCCSMRFAEALRCVYENPFITEMETEKIMRDDKGRYFIGDKILAEDVDNGFLDNERYCVDGKRLIKIPTLIKDSKCKLRILFDK